MSWHSYSFLLIFIIINSPNIYAPFTPSLILAHSALSTPSQVLLMQAVQLMFASVERVEHTSECYIQ